MKSIKVFLVLACVLLAACAFSGCLGSDEPANNSNATYTPVTVVTATKNITEEGGFRFIFEFNGTITPKINEIVEIKVEGNPTTGYEWTASASENSTLKLLDSEYVENSHEEGMVGVGGTYSWYVTSDVAGIHVFDASYARSWESEFAETFSLELTFVE